MNEERLRKLVIVGGGTAGWIAAAAFSRLLSPPLEIELVESEAIGTVGVGEATIPQIIRLNAILGLDEYDFVRRTYGTFKLGIEFVGWGAPGERYLHTFGDAGINLGNTHFHHYWRRYALAGGKNSLWHYSLHVQAARNGKFGRLDRVGNTAMTGLAYAYHFDAGLYAAYLRDYAQKRGVVRSEGVVRSVEREPQNGDILSVTLDDGRVVAGDFFIDCTGFRAMLLGEALGAGYEDWSKWLPCNRAFAVPSERISPLPPFTRATARPAGWQWRIPLQHRTGNGHVFCDAFTSNDDAAGLLLENLEGKALDEPRLLKFRTGRRTIFWSHNCAAIGLSSGFLEPLESTSIHLIQSNVGRLISLLPRDRGYAAERDEYNRRTAQEFEQVRDFLILHYSRTTREDTEFWKYCKNMSVPELLTEKIRLFASSGRLGRDVDDLFKDSSWTQVMLGQGVTPRGYSPMADKITDGELHEFLANVRKVIDRAVTGLATHDEFIKENCAAQVYERN